MKKLVIIPARAGSKRLPNKNLKLLDNKPLIMHSVDIARKIFNDNEICISTNSTKIKAVVEKSGLHVPFLRPEELAQDTSSTEDVLMHALNWYNHNGYEPDIIILLQPTSPFRQLKDINNAIAKFSKEIDMVVSVKEGKANPYFNPLFGGSWSSNPILKFLYLLCKYFFKVINLEISLSLFSVG